MAELLPCPFCGGKARISFKDYRFYGWNCVTHQKSISYRIQVICNKCKSRGKPIITKPMTNPMPYITEWGNCYGGSDKAKAETERFRPYIEEAINCWNTRTPKERGADKPKITCLNCKHLMFSDMYGECNKQLRIVNPSDTCEYAEPKERGGEK